MDNAAFWVVLIIFAAVLRNLSAGTLPDWFRAKFMNAAAGAPDSLITRIAKDQAERAAQAQIPGAGAALGAAGAGPADRVDPAAFDASTLVTVNGAKLSPRFAARWRPLVEAAKADGVNLTGGGYRSRAEQERLYAQNCRNGKCNPPTAKPGNSRHETGDAIDVANCSTRATKAYSWLSRHAPAAGVLNLPSEPWHWSIDGH